MNTPTTPRPTVPPTPAVFEDRCLCGASINPATTVVFCRVPYLRVIACPECFGEVLTPGREKTH